MNIDLTILISLFVAHGLFMYWLVRRAVLSLAEQATRNSQTIADALFEGTE